jgi:hypothetical protein
VLPSWNLEIDTVAAYAGRVRLPVPVVSLADEGIGERMQSARLICTRALVEVAWTLVQKRWQNCAANHDVSEAVDRISTEPLAKAFRSSTVIGVSPLVGCITRCEPDG